MGKGFSDAQAKAVQCIVHFKSIPRSVTIGVRSCGSDQGDCRALSPGLFHGQWPYLPSLA